MTISGTGWWFRNRAGTGLVDDDDDNDNDEGWK